MKKVYYVVKDKNGRYLGEGVPNRFGKIKQNVLASDPGRGYQYSRKESAFTDMFLYRDNHPTVKCNLAVYKVEYVETETPVELE